MEGLRKFLSWAHMTVHSMCYHADLILIFACDLGTIALSRTMLFRCMFVWNCLHGVGRLSGVLIAGCVLHSRLALVSLLLLLLLKSKTVVMRFGTQVKGCDVWVLCGNFWGAFLKHMTTWSVRTFLLASLLEDQWSSFRTDPIEFLLFCYKMHLRLWLNLVAQLGLCQDLLLLLRG